MMIDSKKADKAFSLITSDIAKVLGEGIFLANIPRGDNEMDSVEKRFVWLPDNELLSVALIDNFQTSKLVLCRFPLKDWLRDIGDADHGTYFREKLELDANGNSMLWNEMQKRSENKNINLLPIPGGSHSGVVEGDERNKTTTNVAPEKIGKGAFVAVGALAFCAVALIGAFLYIRNRTKPT
jgi:hypothetical protein